MTRTTFATALFLAVTIAVIMLSGIASAEPGVRVYGFVYDKAGLPVANATVTLLLETVPLPTASNPAITDLHGYYEFPGIQHGVYCLVAEKNAFSSSATIILQTWDKTMNLALQGSTADLVDIRATAATPSPTAGPEIVTATPAAPETTPGPSATPGFDAALALLGIFSLMIVKRLKQ
jgi:hypothetical protein